MFILFSVAKVFNMPKLEKSSANLFKNGAAYRDNLNMVPL